MEDMISAEIVTETWQRMSQTPVSGAPQMVEQMRDEQPVVVSYMLSLVDSPLNTHERKIMAFLGMVVWQLMKQTKRRLNKVTRRKLRKAEEAKAKEKSERKQAEEAARVVGNKDWGVRSGRFQDVTGDIPDGSVDLIFTDPPYARKSLPQYGDLAEVGKRLLVSGGSLITYVPQYAMPEVMNLMTPHLQFLWVVCCHHSGPSTRMIQKGIMVKWKLLLWRWKIHRVKRRQQIDFG